MVKEMIPGVMRCRRVFGGRCRGRALVSDQAISGWGGTLPVEGVIVERGHPLEGQCYTGRILVVRGAKGSSGWTEAFHASRLAGSLPKGIIFTEMTSKIALGCVVMGIPAVTDPAGDLFSWIQTGDLIGIDADRGEIRRIDPAP